MPALKLTKDLVIKDKLDLEYTRLLSDHAKEDNLNDDLLQILKVENAKEQIEIFKKVWAAVLGMQAEENCRCCFSSIDISGVYKAFVKLPLFTQPIKVTKEISRRIKSKPDLDDVELPLRYLIHVFFISTHKNPCRRVLISHFQGLPENVTENIIGQAIKHGLQDLCNQPIRTADSQEVVSSCLQLRHDVDTVAALIENFQLGENCVRELNLEILTYLGNVQEFFFTSYGSWLSPVHQNEIMHHCLETVKLANRICQKSLVTMETRLKGAAAVEVYRHIVLKFITLDMRILQAGDFLLDCKTTSSMNIWVLLRHCVDRDGMIYLASRSVFNHIEWLTKSCDKVKLPDWLDDLDFCQLSKSNLTSSAYLCSCYGFLAMVAMETLCLSINGKCMLLDVLLQEFLELSKRCPDVGSKLLAAKSVHFLTQKIRDYLSQQGVLEPDIQKRLLGDSGDMKAILEFVWTAWEDSVDAIRFTVKDIFENVVAVHLHSSAGTGSSTTGKDDPLLFQLAKSILSDVSWSCKGKYPTLSVLVSHVGSARMMELHPGIAAEILHQMQEQTLACYASDLYEKMFRTHKDELEACQSENGQPEMHQSGSPSWFQEWLVPVLKVICGGNVLQKKHVIEYILPKLLKTGAETLQYIIQCLSGQPSGQSEPSGQILNEGKTGGKLGALIICLRRARALGLLKNQSQGGDGKSDIWCGVVDVNLLQQALVCNEDQTRLDAFALLCENQKTSEVISEIELQLIRNFIPQNLNNQNPAFRQHFLSLLKKFLSRMKESHSALKRKSRKEDKITFSIKQYKDFLCWLARCLFRSLYPGSVFARRSTCLSALVLLKETFGEKNHNSEESYDFFTSVRECDLNALLFCLTDTFEDNKMDAASLLIGCAKNQSAPVVSEHAIKELFEIGLSLSESTRPQDSTTAAYLFSVLTHQQNLHKVITQHIETDLCNTQKETKNAGKELIVTDIEASANDKMLESETDKINSKGDGSNESGTLTNESRGLNQRDCNEHLRLAQNFLCSHGDSELTRRFMLLCVLMKSLESQAGVAKTSLIIAAANKPLYPTIQCMRYCFADIDFRSIPEDSVEPWKALVARFIGLCFEISQVVSPVVCNSSPEGNIPVDALTGIENVDLGNHDNLTRSKETVMLMPEYLIVCCWRSVKEISLLLGQLTSTLAEVGMGSSRAMLTFSQVLQVGEFFTTLLLESKHRGAFELAYAGFVKVTDMLWRSSYPELHQLPRKWLSEVMVDIKSGNPESRLCATRRSAGVPFYVQALVTTEPSSTGRQCFRQTMQELLALATDESVVLQENCVAKVHALNILRALYKDSRLKDDVAPFVAEGLKAAILGFKSPLWAVRNSATLLMTAMMTRIFGVKRSKDETTFSRKNCMTGRTFFYNYPSLYQFLLDQVAMATEHVSSQLHPGLFPILMVLGRLFPSAMEGTDTTLNLAAFLPYVIKCSANPVLKTRVMAAKALQPLVEKDHVMSVFYELLTLLPRQPTDVMKQNQIHGLLLQILQLCRTVPLLPGTEQSKLSTMIGTMWMERINILLSRHNRCLATRTVALEVTSSFTMLLGNLEFIGPLSSIITEELQTFNTAYDPCTPSLSEFQKMLCTLYCDILLRKDCVRPSNELCLYETPDSKQQMNCSYRNEDQSKANSDLSDCDKNREEVISDILKFLNSKSYEVRRTILEKLAQLLSGSKELDSDAVSLTAGDCDQTSHGVELGMDHGVVSALLTHLLEMLDTEEHEECEIQLLRLLETKWIQSVMSGMEELELVQLLDKQLVKLNTENCSDTLNAALITSIGVTLNSLLGKESSETLNGSLSTKHGEACHEKDLVTIATIVTKFITTIRGYTQHMETSAEVLLACAQALVQTCNYILGAKSVMIKIDHQLYVDAVRCVLDLLQADDLEVRETTVLVVDCLSSERFKVHHHPYVALTTLLNHLVYHDQHEDHEHLMSALLEMIVEDKQDINDHEERLFDRGEMNTYWDELDFVQMLDSAVSKYVQAERENSSDLVEVMPSLTGTKITDFKCGKGISLLPGHVKVFVEKFLQHAQKKMPETSSYNLSFADVFFNTSSYQESVLLVYKTLLMCRYSKQLCSGWNCEVPPLAQETIDTLKKDVQKHIWLPIIYDLLIELSY